MARSLKRRGDRYWRFAVFVLAIVALRAAPVRAHEVDQYRVPVGEELVDLGSYWNNLLFRAVRDAVVQTNADIGTARRIIVPELRRVRLAHLHSPETLTFRVRQNLPTALMAIEALEMKLRLKGRRDPATGKLLAYRAPVQKSTFSHAPLLPDPRQISRMFFMRCSTIKVHGQYIGTDKIGHFIAMGYLYYQAYRAAVAAGKDHEESLAVAGKIGKWNPISEGGLLGMIPTGVYSNADQAANYVGMKFYLNITRDVRLKDKTVPAMAALHSGVWRLRPHVRPDGDFFALFVSQHFDEALNPSVYEIGIRGRIRESVRHRGAELLDWYAGDDPRKRSREHFDQILQQCLTYYGEPYGHSGSKNSMITLSNVCFDDKRSPHAKSVRLAKADAAAVPAALEVRGVGPRLSYVDQSGEYSVLVTNLAPQDEEHINVTVEVPCSMQVTLIERTAVFDRQHNRIRWSVPRLASGASAVLRFQARGEHPGRQTCQISVTGNRSKLSSAAVATRIASLPVAGVPATVVAADGSKECGRLLQAYYAHGVK